MADSVYTIKVSTLANGASLASGVHSLVRKSNGDLAAIYIRSDGTRNQVYVAESTDEGVSWTETALTNSAYAKELTSICVDDHDRLYAFYAGRDDAGDASNFTNVRVKTDGGSWGSRIKVSAAGAYCGGSAVCDANGRIWIAHVQGSGSDLYARYSDDHGATWSSGTLLHILVYTDIQLPCIQINPATGYPAVVYQRILSAIRTFYYRENTDGGATWTSAAIVAVNTAGHAMGYCHFTFDEDGVVHLVSTEGSGTAYRIRYSVNFGASVAISSNHDCYAGKIVINTDGEIFIFWHGYTAGATTYRQIQSRKSTDGGANWDAQVTLTSGNYQLRYPIVMCYEYPKDGSAFVDKPKIGYALAHSKDADIIFRFSADLEWNFASTTMEFTDLATGSDAPKVNKVLKLSDSGAGADAETKVEVYIFADTGEGIDSQTIFKIMEFIDSGLWAENISIPERVICYPESAGGTEVFGKPWAENVFPDGAAAIDNLLANKILKLADSAAANDNFCKMLTALFTDCGAGVEDFLKYMTTGFADSGRGAETFIVSYPYPINLKRIIIFIRDKV